MAKTSDDYRAQGRAARLSGDTNGPKPYTRQSPSWQARAFWEGYDMAAAQGGPWSAKTPEQVYEDIAVANAKPVEITINLKRPAQTDIINLDGMPDDLVGWPQAAAHHALLLAARLNESRSGKEVKRLERSLHRLALRHAPR